jgi:DNA ligase-1
VGVRADVAAKSPAAKATTKPTSAQVSSAKVAPTTAGAGVTKPRYFEYVEGASNKFWEVSCAGDALSTRWGRIGSTGQSKTKTFANEQAAAAAMAKLIEEKTGEGYVER